MNILDHSQFYTGLDVPAKTILLREGETARQAYYIVKGCLRLWFNDNGKDITFQFFFEGQGVSSVESFRTGRPSLFNLETLEPCNLLVSNGIKTCCGTIPRSCNASPSIISPAIWVSPPYR